MVTEPSSTSIAVEEGVTPLQLDVGFLCSVDANQVDLRKLSVPASVEDAVTPAQEAASTLREAYLLSRARNATQHLLNSVFALPFNKNQDVGPLVTLPAILPSSHLCSPREKPMPKTTAKPLTKWEKFAQEKGISHRKKDRMIFDEAKQEWVPRWGFKGANQDVENQWIHEIPANKEEGYHPGQAATKARKERKAVNEGKRLKNLQRIAAESGGSSSKGGSTEDKALAREAKKSQLEGDLMRSKRATASMGRFDRSLPNESSTFKTKALKRKFQPNEQDTSQERNSQLALANKIDRLGAKAVTSANNEKRGQGDPELVNARKAVKFASRGHGSAALASKLGGKGGPKKRK